MINRLSPGAEYYTRLSEKIDKEKHDRVWVVDGEHSHHATFVFMYRTLGKCS